MDELIRDFENKMHLEGKSEKTIKIYITSVNEFFRWFNDSFGDVGFKKLYRENILEYKSYLKNSIEIPLKNICGIDVGLMKKSMPVYQKEMAKCFGMAVASGLVYLLADSFTKD